MALFLNSLIEFLNKAIRTCSFLIERVLPTTSISWVDVRIFRVSVSSSVNSGCVFHGTGWHHLSCWPYRDVICRLWLEIFNITDVLEAAYWFYHQQPLFLLLYSYVFLLYFFLFLFFFWSSFLRWALRCWFTTFVLWEIGI